MSEDPKVVPLHGASVRSDRKSALLDYVAGAFDFYVEKAGEEPDAVVAVFGGIKQSARASWIMQGQSEGGAASMLALAHAAILREVWSDD